MANIQRNMQVSEKIRQKILDENIFSLKVAMVLDIKQASVIDLAKRNSDKLTLYTLVEFYKKEGFTEEDIFAHSVGSNNN